MAVDTLIAGLPPDLELAGGWTIRLTAIDPTAGTVVSGVVVSEVSVLSADLSGGLVDATVGPFMLVPGPGA